MASFTTALFPDPAAPGIPLPPAGQNPAARAITDATGRTVTYGQLRSLIEHVAGGLAAQHIAPGQHVGVRLENSIAFAAAFHGVLTAGGVVVPLSGEPPAGVNLAYLIDATTYPDLAVCPDTVPIGAIDIDADTPVCLPASSGTTGIPKLVVLTHRNLTANVRQFSSVVPITSGDTVLGVLPFTHIFGLTAILNVSLYLGAHLIALPFTPASFCDAFGRYGVTVAYIAPPLARLLATSPEAAAADFSQLRVLINGGAALDVASGTGTAARTGARVIQGYGMTEASPVTHLTVSPNTPMGSIGRPIPDTHQRIVDPATITDVAPGEVGELWVAGPQVMAGYWNDPEATQAALVGRWLRTGDLARELPGGDVEIVDRLKDVIKYHGFQVSPVTLEAILTGMPGITDAAVTRGIGEDGEEIPVAYVVGTAAPSEIMDYVAARVASYERIRRVEYVDAIPRSATGKILRRLLP
ncbi:MAG: AMP-binding protein [Corynebacterium sp.]|nr:AMP-binding protein [Corynebacterium sp.]